jgi:hypothetical protein
LPAQCWAPFPFSAVCRWPEADPPERLATSPQAQEFLANGDQAAAAIRQPGSKLIPRYPAGLRSNWHGFPRLFAHKSLSA